MENNKLENFTVGNALSSKDMTYEQCVAIFGQTIADLLRDGMDYEDKHYTVVAVDREKGEVTLR